MGLVKKNSFTIPLKHSIHLSNVNWNDVITKMGKMYNKIGNFDESKKNQLIALIKPNVKLYNKSEFGKTSRNKIWDAIARELEVDGER